MPSNSTNPAAPPATGTRSPTFRRLIAAAVLIGLAIGTLALVDRLRERPAGLAPPHEPSQALMITPAPEGNTQPSTDQAVTVTPPPPPQVVNNETLPPPQRATDAMPPSAPAPETAPTDNNALVAGKAYMVQVGVFTSPANAQALQKQLKRAGIEARLETRVQLGPFKDRRDADKALARAKKLGINAVLVSAR